MQVVTAGRNTERGRSKDGLLHLLTSAAWYVNRYWSLSWLLGPGSSSRSTSRFNGSNSPPPGLSWLDSAGCRTIAVHDGWPCCAPAWRWPERAGCAANFTRLDRLRSWMQGTERF